VSCAQGRLVNIQDTAGFKRPILPPTVILQQENDRLRDQVNILIQQQQQISKLQELLMEQKEQCKEQMKQSKEQMEQYKDIIKLLKQPRLRWLIGRIGQLGD
jgi:hypothetical protein